MSCANHHLDTPWYKGMHCLGMAQVESNWRENRAFAGSTD